ncbi:hypothetical protein PRIPAC_71253 [Pristionchus pacificus]|uniref:Trypsin n=1 Tax=Pristionchus pacificus TaxID=54126 RepID=A0A2A6C0H8_PRIPA|nr:hypothetical protein PRIPAC_71253 [Pristionchus pacificus]|eukprot:PDM71619.1 Trypsin [Pristionchus pacificus]
MRALLPLLLLLLCTLTILGQNCGKRKLPRSRIVGGNEVPPGKWPWHYYRPKMDSNSRALLTVYSKTNIVHEDFVTYGHKDGDVVNDITLIELAEPLPFGRYVQTVCLPSKKTVVSREAQVFASGFGSWNDRAVPLDYKREAGLILRETVFPLIPKELCSDRLVKVKPSFSGNVPDTQLCTGSFGHGTAEGDSGGPVVMRTKKGVWYQVGITSWGFNEVENIHKQDDSPGVYTNVHEYCDWIEEKTRGEAKCRDAKLTIRSKNVIVHEAYEELAGERGKLLNDITLLELEEPISFDRFVQPVCLPSKDTTIPRDSIVIRTLERGRFSNYTENIANTQLCGGAFGHGTAPGDSGGPVVMKTKEGAWFQVGITSWGFAIHEQDTSPGVYTNVHKYCDWIEEKTGGEAKCQDAVLIDATAEI